MINFPARKLQAFSGKLKTQSKDGLKPVEFVEMKLASQPPKDCKRGVAGSSIWRISSRNLSGHHVAGGAACAFELVIPKSGETFVELGEVVCTPVTNKQSVVRRD